MKNIVPCIVAAACIMVSAPHTASAQLNNKPFSFSRSTDGIGMSQGGRQAILNDKIFNTRPDNLIRGNGGLLLDVTEGPGKSATVFFLGTNTVIPGYHGTSYKGDNNPMMEAGVFNSFFVPSSGSSIVSGFGAEISAAVVNTWTSRVISGGAPMSYNNGSLVDIWTGQVFAMSPY